jgi:hypothetical protein
MLHWCVINSVVMWLHILVGPCWCVYFALFRSSQLPNSATYWGADKSLARPGRKQTWKHVRDTRDFSNIETRAGIKIPPQGKAAKEIHIILTETLVCFLPGRAKDLSAPLYTHQQGSTNICSHITTELITHQCTIIVYFNKCNFSKHK